MIDGPRIAAVAALVGDPARANMLTAMMDGRALTASELAAAGGVTLPTASGHLARLLEAQLVQVRNQGRHRYFSLARSDIAEALESLMTIAQRTGSKAVRTGPADAALRKARICYDHLAGELGVQLLDSLRGLELIDGDPMVLTDAGRAYFAELGIDLAALKKGRRPLCRACLDWSERRSHLGGALGAALLSWMLDSGWIQRQAGRALRLTPLGTTAFSARFRAAQAS